MTQQLYRIRVRWREWREELARRLVLIGLHPPKWAKDVPEQFADAYFDLMPIHEKLRGRDAPAVHSYLRVTMCNIHDELADRLDAPAVMHSLRRGKQQVVLPGHRALPNIPADHQRTLDDL